MTKPQQLYNWCEGEKVSVPVLLTKKDENDMKLKIWELYGKNKALSTVQEKIKKIMEER